MSTTRVRETADGAPPSRDELFAALGRIIDPELGADIVTLGMVGSADVDGTDATIGVKLTTKSCPLRGDIAADIVDVLGRHPGLTTVSVEFAEMNSEERAGVMERARLNAQANAPRPNLPPSCRVIPIASGKGGVGKSSVTVNLATALALDGHTVGILDADIWGFSIPRLTGIDERMAAHPHPHTGRPLIDPVTQSVGSGELRVVSTGFLVDDTTALMWRGMMLNKAVEQFLVDVDWGDLDYLLIDMPPGTGDVQMGIARMLPHARMIVVTTPATAAQRVAQRAADMARRSFLPIAGVIENMSGFTCDHGQQYDLFGAGGGQALAEAIGVPLLAQIPLEPTISASNDAGQPAAAGDGAAAAAFAELATRIQREIDFGPDSTTGADGCSARLLDAVNAAFADD